jgi:hypothetical protein
MVHHIQGNTAMREFSYSYADTNMRALLNNDYGRCRWNWQWPQTASTRFSSFSLIPTPDVPIPVGLPPCSPVMTTINSIQLVEQDIGMY